MKLQIVEVVLLKLPSGESPATVWRSNSMHSSGNVHNFDW
jgi:hypothetical protein